MPPPQLRAVTLSAWRRLAFWALGIHGAWETIQCAFFYEMGAMPSRQAAASMLGSTLADTVLTLLLLGSVFWLRKRASFSDRMGALALLLLGIFVAASIEILAQQQGWWRYSPRMPEIAVAGFSVGLFPVLQMALLPLLCEKLARYSDPQIINGTRSRPRGLDHDTPQGYK